MQGRRVGLYIKGEENAKNEDYLNSFQLFYTN